MTSSDELAHTAASDRTRLSIANEGLFQLSPQRSAFGAKNELYREYPHILKPAFISCQIVGTAVAHHHIIHASLVAILDVTQHMRSLMRHFLSESSKRIFGRTLLFLSSHAKSMGSQATA